jgi:type II secretion system protein D
MKKIPATPIALFIAIFILNTNMAQIPQDQKPQTQSTELVSLNLPNSTIEEVLEYYSTLTGARYVRDANLIGPNLRIIVSTPVPLQEAIRIIEASLNMNGYSLVPFGDNTFKVINNAARNPRSQGVPIITDINAAPPGEPVVALFIQLRFISPEDAISIFQQQLPFNPQYGSLLPVKNAQAIIATETISYLKNLISLQKLIDVPPAPLKTEFVQLIHADAAQVSETVLKVLDEQAQAGGTSLNVGIPSAIISQTGITMQTTGSALPTQGISGIKLIPDKRTNRILIICKPAQFNYVKNLVNQFDQVTDLRKPFERFLKYISASEVLPVLKDILSEDTQDSSADFTSSGIANPGFRTGGAETAPTPSGNIGSRIAINETLSDPVQDNTPESVIVGNTRIVANKRANSIIVFGYPENVAKIQTLLDLLDNRPLQVYISTVIGQLAVGDGMTTAIDIFRKYGKGTGDFQFAGALRNRTGPVTAIPNLQNAPNFPNLQGFTFYGVFFDFIETYVQMLESTNRFRVTSRPVIFTANNKKATILSGQEVPVPRSTQSVINPGIQPGTNLGVTSDIDYKEVVLKLEVVPLINANKEVTLDIIQRNDSIIGSSNISGITVPNIGTQQIRTSITVPNRSTVVLGGLITNEKERTLTGAPFLSRVPVLGYLFRSTQDRKQRSELVILMQPAVIDSHESYEANKVRELQRYEISSETWEASNPGTQEYIKQRERHIQANAQNKTHDQQAQQQDTQRTKEKKSTSTNSIKGTRINR